MRFREMTPASSSTIIFQQGIPPLLIRWSLRLSGRAATIKTPNDSGLSLKVAEMPASAGFTR